MSDLVLLGEECVAVAAVDAGLTAAYGYPGTPSTEILEYLVSHAAKHGRPRATWSVNEKTAYEQALGVSMSGRRSIVTMKHVGLNVAADPFINSALVGIRGGLVVAVADDPGMHSSQDEQDSRWLADFARVPCLEPATHQEAYDMTRDAFELSECFRVPVLLRLVTRLAHSRGIVRTSGRRPENALQKAPDWREWTLLPANARVQWHRLLDRQPAILAWSESSLWNGLRGAAVDVVERRELGVITTGLARNYYDENAEDLASPPLHLHIGAYPLPVRRIRSFLSRVRRVLVLEEGYPYLERLLRGIVPPLVDVDGKQSGHVPDAGELTPDIVRVALGLRERPATRLPRLALPSRPPQLCAGCPHIDSLQAVTAALDGFEAPVVASDIGCYTLGALPPYSAIQSCVCMGASIGMAKGAADAGVYPVVAVIGDSTFLHSGITPLIDAVAADTDMTVLILDNGTVAMTGGQPTVLPSPRLAQVVLGLGVERDHFHVVEAHPRRRDQMASVIRGEIGHRGLSVIIAARQCIETAKRERKEKRRSSVTGAQSSVPAEQ